MSLRRLGQRGPGRTSTSRLRRRRSTQTRPSRTARMRSQPGRCADRLRVVVGNHDDLRVGAHHEFGIELGERCPARPARRWRRRCRVSSSPMMRRLAGGIGAAVDFEIHGGAAQRRRQAARRLRRRRPRCAAHVAARRAPRAPAPPAASALRTSASVLGSTPNTWMPRPSSRAIARDDDASSTRSGLSATMVSMFVSSTPPTRGSCAHGGGPVGVVVDADQPLARAQLAHGLGQRRQHGDDALRRPRQVDRDAAVVHDLHGLHRARPAPAAAEQPRPGPPRRSHPSLRFSHGPGSSAMTMRCSCSTPSVSAAGPGCRMSADLISNSWPFAHRVHGLPARAAPPPSRA